MVDHQDLRNQMQLGIPVLHLEPEVQESVYLGNPVLHLLRQMESLMLREESVQALSLR